MERVIVLSWTMMGSLDWWGTERKGYDIISLTVLSAAQLPIREQTDTCTGNGSLGGNLKQVFRVFAELLMDRWQWLVLGGLWTLLDPRAHTGEALTNEAGVRSSFHDGLINSDLHSHTMPVVGTHQGHPFCPVLICISTYHSWHCPWAYGSVPLPASVCFQDPHNYWGAHSPLALYCFSSLTLRFVLRILFFSTLVLI